MSAKWIWYPGDFEQYHSMLLHSRRQEYDYAYPVMWHVSRPEFTGSFSVRASIPEETQATIYAKGKGYFTAAGKKYPLNEKVVLPAGEYDLTAVVCSLETFPTIFLDCPYLQTDEKWISHFNGSRRKHACCEPTFTKPEDDPAVFPFSYKELKPVLTEEVQGGRLYDFGVESFGPVTLSCRKEMGRISIYYGESRTEALDTEYAYLREHIEGADEKHTFPARAFRYLFIRTESGKHPEVTASLEYLPLEDIASFSCDDEKLADVWALCTRAFHLNSREFFLDGIKRDRWVWSGDAYQSFMVNRYLYNDPQITKRTIRALLDKPPYVQHINAINDYSAYMFLAVYDYYFATGDAAFVREIKDRLLALYAFITSRLDEETGYVVARPGDWIFIDWADIDKDGPLCAEQILLYMVYKAMAALKPVLDEEEDFRTLGMHQYEVRDALMPAGREKEDYEKKAEALRERILKDFWDEEKQAFIDTFASGKRHVTRHANIFAILYDFVDEEKKDIITKNVLLSDQADPITTPYFKLFELMALAKMGEMEAVQDYITSYWGGMADNGATSAWEEFDPRKSGDEHYAMYGEPYGCSLCHAWGSGPILLLGRFCAGVQPTSSGSRTYEVAPRPGRYTRFEAVVPIGEGKVEVSLKDGQICVRSDVPGGVLKWKGQEIPIPAGEEVVC